ncbi:MAG TPA: DUF2752 domain-containing protein [Vicinamibacteria bacterium]
MTPLPSQTAPGPAPWGLRFKAPAGRLPLGAVFGTIAGLGALAVGLLGLDRLPFAVCVFKGLTGLPCPTCGSTRALGRLVSLDLLGALAMNPLATMSIVLLFVWALADFGLLARGRALEVEMGRPLGRIVRVLAVTLVVVNWAYLLGSGR